VRALLSVSDKRGIVQFARDLVALKWEIVSTGGTAEALRREQVPVTGIEDVTGFPEMMDGRVKTLHPKVHGALLARRDHPGDVAALEQHGITPIDLVAVNLAPHRSQCYAPLEIENLADHNWRMKDLLGAELYERFGDDLQKQGLYLDLPPHGAQLFHFVPA